MNISATNGPIATKFLSETSLGWGKGCIRFWVRSNRNSGFHGNGENLVSTLAPLFLMGSSSYLQVRRTIISRTSSKFGQIQPRTAELAALERLKKFS